MELFQIREKEIFETLKRIKHCSFVIIGGYAVNAYTLPRFSVDCDLVLERSELNNLQRELELWNYKPIPAAVHLPYHENFRRYEKTLPSHFKVSMDLLIDAVYDRQTRALFSAAWVFTHSHIRMLKGKTVPEILELRIVDVDALIVMKAISCRNTDIRDLFMLVTQAKDMKWIKEEIAQRCDVHERLSRIKKATTALPFKNSLQGVYGYVDTKLFEKHTQILFALAKETA